MADITRKSIQLPSEISTEIIQKTQENSAVMQLARQVQLPGNGVTIPVITGDAKAKWVTEGTKKPVSNPTLEKKELTPYKLAVIETFSQEFKRDYKSLYDELVKRLPLALAQEFDATVFGATNKPGENFDQLKECTAQEIGTNAYDGLVAADMDISTHNGIVSGYVISPVAKGTLLASKDQTGRPLFINSVSEGSIPMILGAKTLQSKGAYVAGSPNTVGFIGDWTQAVYGTVEGVQIKFSDQATVGDVNLFEQNMFAVLAEIELGFRCDTTVFNKLTKA